MMNRDILSGVSIPINKLKQSFAFFKLVLDSYFIGVKYCTDHVVVIELIIRICRDEMEIKQQIAGGILGGRSHTSIQIDNGSAGGFGCVISHDKRFDGLIKQGFNSCNQSPNWLRQIDKTRGSNLKLHNRPKD